MKSDKIKKKNIEKNIEVVKFEVAKNLIAEKKNSNILVGIFMSMNKFSNLLDRGSITKGETKYFRQ